MIGLWPFLNLSKWFGGIQMFRYKTIWNRDRYSEACNNHLNPNQYLDVLDLQPIMQPFENPTK